MIVFWTKPSMRIIHFIISLVFSKAKLKINFYTRTLNMCLLNLSFQLLDII